MKLIFIRHGEPNYNNDSLTTNGLKEAQALANRVSSWKVTQFYVSPMGRAKETAAPTLKRINREAITLDYIREFSYHIHDPFANRDGIPWDFAPSYWTSSKEMFELDDSFSKFDCLKDDERIKTNYNKTIEQFDKLLESYGYIRENRYYRNINMEERFLSNTVGPNNEILDLGRYENTDDEPTLVFFCHLGIICVILSHLLNIPFETLAHGFFIPTTSVTVLSTEERWSNEAYFRVQTIGDTRHLYENGIKVSPAGSFTSPFQF